MEKQFLEFYCCLKFVCLKIDSCSCCLWGLVLSPFQFLDFFDDKSSFLTLCGFSVLCSLHNVVVQLQTQAQLETFIVFTFLICSLDYWCQMYVSYLSTSSLCSSHSSKHSNSLLPPVSCFPSYSTTVCVCLEAAANYCLLCPTCTPTCWCSQ